jgi:hypothetical protein
MPGGTLRLSSTPMTSWHDLKRRWRPIARPLGCPFNPRALTWEPGERSEWRRSARWHVDVSVSSGFERRERVYLHTVENSRDLARFAAHHRPFYERLYAQRLDVTPWEQDESS